MRNFRLTSIIQRLNNLNKSSTFLTKSSNMSSSLTKRPLTLYEENSNFSNSKRYSSSGDGSHGSDFKRSSLLYTLFGGTIVAGSLALYTLNGPSKPQLETPKPIIRSTQEKQEEEETEEEEVAVVEKSNKNENVAVSQNASEEEEISETPEIFTKVTSEATKLDEESFLPEIPSHAQYLIVGGGTAAMSAFKAIRAKDPTAKVLVITEEQYKPYMRPPLSKDLWTTDDEKLINELKFKQYNGNERSLLFLEDEFYVKPKFLNTEQCANGGVAVVTGKRVTEIDIEGKKVRLDNNWEIAYEKCLLATGGKPKNLPIFENSWEKFNNNVTLFRNIADFKRLYAIAKEGKNIVIVGGGFLGSELACALAHLSKKYGGSVTQIYPESGNLSKVLPEYLSKWTTKRVKEEGVTIIPKATISNAQIDDGKVAITLDSLSATEGPDKKWIVADHVVVAVGLDPNVQLASKSGFETDPILGGYVVNAELQARHGVWAAGDAACFYDVKLGRRRVEHHDHAVVSGRLAGENMTGAGKPYWHQSMFWSDLGPKIGFEAIGLVDSSLKTVGLFAKADEEDTPAAQVKESNETLRSEVKEGSPVESIPDPRTPKESDEFGKGVVLYLKNDKIVGILLWNVFKAVPIARQLIQSNDKVTDFKEIAKLFKINATGEESK